MDRLKPFFPELAPAQWDLLARMAALQRLDEGPPADGADAAGRGGEAGHG